MKKVSKLLLSSLLIASLTGLINSPKVDAVYFKNCGEAYASGYGDILRGQDGYSTNLDSDDDGIACELKYARGRFRPRRADGRPLNAVRVVKNGWQKEGGYWYYYINGTKATNRWIDNDYYVKADGRMAQNEWLSYGGAYYYLGDDGAYWHNRWKGDYFLQGDGAMAVQKWVLYKNEWYYVNAKGVYLTSWQKVNGSWYYLDAYGAMVTGWRHINGTWYYLKADGAMATGWTRVKGLWYYLKADGAMATGWQALGGKWYYLNGDGVMQASKWQGDYYLGADGAMLVDTVTPDGYRVDASGKWVPEESSSSVASSDESSLMEVSAADETSSDSESSQDSSSRPFDYDILENASDSMPSDLSQEGTESAVE